MEQVAQTEAPPRHHELGLSDDDVLAMYRQMLVARAVDERMWLMQRAGKIAFIISGQGHEGAQVAIAWPMRRGHDWMAPYYRSIASAITFGMDPEDIITAHLAKGDDVSSGGRQMPGHYGGAPLQPGQPLARRSAPRCCTRWGSPWAPGCAATTWWP